MRARRANEVSRARAVRAFLLACSTWAMTGCGDVLGLNGDYGAQGESADGGSPPTGEGPAPPTGGEGPSSANDAAAGTPGDAAAGDPDAGSPTTSDASRADVGPIGNPGTDASSPEAEAPADAANDAAAVIVSPILRVYAGSTSVAAGASSQTVTLSSIDPGRAFVVAGATFSATEPTQTEVTAQIASSTAVTFARTGGSGAPAIPVAYYVAEFQSGVQVQRGSAAMSATTVSVPLPSSVNLANSFPIITYRNTGSTTGLDDYVRAKLTSGSQLSLGINLAAPDGIVEWQVVSFSGATVQSGDITMGGSDTVVTATLPNAVSPGATWLLLSNEVSNAGGTTAELLVSGRVSSSTDLTFSRAAGGATNQITWYAVSFTNGTTVQSSSLTLDDSATTATVPLAAVDPLKSIAVTGGVWLRGGTTVHAGAANPGFGTYRLNLGTGAQLEVDRGASGTATQSSVDLSVVQFF
jgi:hypothetical protein